MKTRNLSGMTVTEIKAPTQAELFAKLAKFTAKDKKSIECVSLDYQEDNGPDAEVATVVWA